MMMLFSSAVSGANPGKAVADWISVSTTAKGGQALHTAIRLKHDAGWHSYWTNPGEAGIPTSVEWKLPPGWQHGGLKFPPPSRFSTSGLISYGYDGIVQLPVTLTPPKDFTGSAELKAVVSWLACGEDGCVPGEATVRLELCAGVPSATAEHDAILSALRLLPTPHEGVRMEVTEMPTHLAITLTHHGELTADFSKCQIFPVTPEVIDPSADLRFERHGGYWILTAPLGEYAQKPVQNLTLVLHGGGLETPLELSWNAPPKAD